jgi:hypothetical protein
MRDAANTIVVPPPPPSPGFGPLSPGPASAFELPLLLPLLPPLLLPPLLLPPLLLPPLLLPPLLLPPLLLPPLLLPPLLLPPLLLPVLSGDPPQAAAASAINPKNPTVILAFMTRSPRGYAGATAAPALVRARPAKFPKKSRPVSIG